MWCLRAGFEGVDVATGVAGIAQLVEHHLAKVGVAGSSPVSRFSRNGEARRAGCGVSPYFLGAVAKW